MFAYSLLDLMLHCSLTQRKVLKQELTHLGGVQIRKTFEKVAIGSQRIETMSADFAPCERAANLRKFASPMQRSISRQFCSRKLNCPPRLILNTKSGLAELPLYQKFISAENCRQVRFPELSFLIESVLESVFLPWQESKNRSAGD